MAGSRAVAVALIAIVCAECTAPLPYVDPQIRDYEMSACAAVCGRLAACGIIDSLEQSDCTAELASSFRVRRGKIDAHYDAAIAAKRIAFDPAGAQACIDQFAQLECAGLYDWGTPGRMLDPTTLHLLNCPSMFRGSVPPGQTCFGTDECQNGSCDTHAACPSTCFEYSPEGADCGLYGQCDPRSDYCDPTLGVCAPRKPMDASCQQSYECLVGLTCDDGSCGPPQPYPVGHRCVEYIDCASEQCLNGVCAPRGRVGESCSLPFQCEIGLRCVGATFSGQVTPGLCEPSSRSARPGSAGERLPVFRAM